MINVDERNNILKKEIEERVREKTALAHARSQMVYFFMVGSSILFTFLSVSFLFFLSTHFLIVPAFHVSTIALLFVSWFIHRSYQAAQNNQLEELHKYFNFFFTAIVVFLIIQLIGWQELISVQDKREGDVYVLFLVITFVHFLHILVGLIMSFKLHRKVKNFQIHSKSILFMKAVTWYWHFLGIVWLFFYIMGSF